MNMKQGERYNVTVVGSVPTIPEAERLKDTLGSQGVDHSQISTLSGDDPILTEGDQATPLSPESIVAANPETAPLVTKRSLIEGQVVIIGFPAALVATVILITEAVSENFFVNLFIAVVAGALVGFLASKIADRLGGQHRRALKLQQKRGGILVFVTALTAEQKKTIDSILADFSTQPLAEMPPEG